MTDRAGPPSLRNEPWRPGTTSPDKLSEPTAAAPERPRPCPQEVSDHCVWPRCSCVTTEAQDARYRACVVIPDPIALVARDKLCAEWVDRNYTGIASAREIMIAKTAFCAGWSDGVNHAKNNSPEPVDLRCAMCKTED